ncbi:unnamed protein product, partial [Brassica napus]
SSFGSAANGTVSQGPLVETPSHNPSPRGQNQRNGSASQTHGGCSDNFSPRHFSLGTKMVTTTTTTTKVMVAGAARSKGIKTGIFAEALVGEMEMHIHKEAPQHL